MKLFLLTLAVLVASVAGQSVGPDEFSCCKLPCDSEDSEQRCHTYGDQNYPVELIQCGLGSGRPEGHPWTQGAPYQCKRVVCCTDPGCGGICTEDRNVAGECTGMMKHVCEDDESKQAYKCCTPGTDCAQCEFNYFHFDSIKTCPDIWCGDSPFSPENSNFGNCFRTDLCPSSGSTGMCCYDECNGDRCQIHQHTKEECDSEYFTTLVPPRVFCGASEMDGDPHLKLWNSKWMDFHGVCDLVLVENPSFREGLGMKLHVRTTGRYEYSFISSAALQIGSDVLEVGSWGDYSLNNVASAHLPNMLSGFEVTYEKINKKRHHFEVDLGKGSKIVFITFKDIVNVKIEGAQSRDFDQSVGMMGEFGSGAMLSRNGSAVIEDPNQFGLEWQVLANEPKLFQEDRSPQLSMGEQCIMPSPQTEEIRTRRLGESKTRAEAEAACDWWGPAAKERCIKDVLLSGDIELAEVGP